ncbi:MAG: nitrogen fixation protein, partial [Microcystis aeruginosa BS11-05]|nr:nitrogen fixation protein [Microcystis aeruginosa BS11-05]
VTDILPPCRIRQNCRWWLQEGKAACLRCPQVVTDNYNPSEIFVKVAEPES